MGADNEIPESQLTPSPLFAPYLKGNETCYAERIRYVRVFLCEEDDNDNEQRSLLKKRDQPMEINPRRHTDQDIADAFEPGTYWVEAIRAVAEGKEKPGSRMPGGHYVRVAGAEAQELEEEEEARARAHHAAVQRDGAAGQTVASEAIKTMAELLRAKTNGSPIDDAIKMQQAFNPRQDTPPQIVALNNQLDELRRILRKTEDAASETLEAERKRSRNELDDAKRDARRAIEAVEKTADERIADLRAEDKRRGEQWGEERKRLQNDIDDWRSKYRKDMDRAEEDRRKELGRADAEFERYRMHAEKRSADLESEVLALKRQLAELVGRFDIQKMELERANKDLALTKKDAAELEEEIDDLKKEVDQAEETAKKAKSVPVDGILGWVINQVGEDGIKALIPAVMAMTGNAPPGQLPGEQKAAPVVASEPARETARRVVRQPAPTAQPAPAPAPAPAADTVRVTVGEQIVEAETGEVEPEQEPQDADAEPTDVDAELEKTGS